MGTAFGYVWRIGANLVYIAVILYVFGQLQTRDEQIIVSILGLLYATIRVIGFGNARVSINLGKTLDAIDAQVRKIADPGFERDLDTSKELARLANTAEIRLAIESVFVGVVSLICLWHLFSHLEMFAPVR